MQLSDLQSYIGPLVNDPNHDRYSLFDIGTELDNAMNQWNEEIKIIKETTIITEIVNQRQYLLSLITGTPIAFARVTHLGIDLFKRSKAYFDLYGNDWTQDIGTPIEYCIEATDPSNLYITLHPTPQAVDAGPNLVVEAIIGHTSMVNPTDVPFMLGTLSNYLLRPYDFYLANNVAARLLARFPSPENSARAGEFLKISAEGKASLVQVLKALEAEEPKRLKGGRYWNSGNVKLAK